MLSTMSFVYIPIFFRNGHVTFQSNYSPNYSIISELRLARGSIRHKYLECSRLHRRRQCYTCRCILVSVEPSRGTLLVCLHGVLDATIFPLSVMARFLSAFVITVINITTPTHIAIVTGVFMTNQPTSAFRNSSSVIPSPSVDIITSLASLFLSRCCSHGDVVTLARFPRQCSADVLRKSLHSPSIAAVCLLGLPRFRFTTA